MFKIFKDKTFQTTRGFLDFLRSQGVVGLAVGFILGGAVSQLVQALVNDIINPILSIALGAAENFQDRTLEIGSIVIKWGHFLNILINFIVVAAVVYLGYKLLQLDKIDKKKT